MNQAPNIVKKTKDLLVIASNDGRHSTRVYEFRKLKGRPIEMQTRCTVHGVYNPWQVAPFEPLCDCFSNFIRLEYGYRSIAFSG